MLAPSLIASADYYNTPNSEKGMPTKKRLSSEPKSPVVDGQGNGASVHSAMERRVSDITSDISLDNLLEGSRRKRNKFSSDLPLLPLPTPASVSYQFGHARTQSGARERAGSASTTATVLQTPGRVSIPTPAPTTISDEDVALQLIRLGDPSLSPCKPQSSDSSSPIPNLTTAMQLKALHDEMEHQAAPSAKREVDYPSSPPASVSDTEDQPSRRALVPSLNKPASKPEKRLNGLSEGKDHVAASDELERSKDETDIEDELDIPRPQNLPHFHDAMQCKTADVEIPAADEKPIKNGPSVGVRCTRCKKSKKGCDRQRPCGRCADANEDCVTEDESSGRRGRNNRGGRRKR